MPNKIRARLWPKTNYGVALLFIFGLALSLRVLLPFEGVFVGDRVNFGQVDSWYHLRLVENLLEHFPQRIAFDPYTFYPQGQNVFFAPFFDLLLGFATWIVGLGSPSQQTIETVAAYFPAVLGALVTIPVYFIGRELFNRNVGLVSAALIAILPGEFLLRSLLGFTDHHVAEVLFSAITVLFLILAIKSAKEKETSFSHIQNREWGNIKKPLIYALLAGIALGIYILSWVGGLLFVFIIFAYLVIQYIVDHLTGKSTDYLCIIGVPLFLIALIMVIPFLHQGALEAMHLVALAIGTAAFPILSGVSKLMERRKIKRVYYPLSLVALGLAGLGSFYAIAPASLSSMVGKFSIFLPKAGPLTITEVRPLFSDFDLSSLTQNRVWWDFTTGFFIVPISLILIAYSVIKKVSAEKILFLSWSVIMLVAMLGQSRFAYYFAVNAAILGGYFCWKIPGWTSRILEELGLMETPEPERTRVEYRGKKKEGKADGRKRGKARRESLGIASRYLGPRYVSNALAVIIGFFLVFYPNIGPATTLAKEPEGPNEDWYDSLLWMRDNTPDPFQDPNFYYELYERPSAGERYDYPESAYGVMSWWDYGHWITRIGRRIPNSNPHQKGVAGAARFFIAQDESSANLILDRLGSKYIIIDVQMATTKFYAMAIWAGENRSQFFETYYRRTATGELEPTIFYYPKYYRSMSSRLYNFGGKAVVPDNSTRVISYVEKTDAEGNKYKEISSIQLFPTFEEAETYLESQTSPNYRIVGVDRFVSPVPLNELEHYKPIYGSNSIVRETGDRAISYVAISEYLP